MGAVEDLERIWFRHDCVLHRGANDSPYGGVGEPVPFFGFVKQTTKRIDEPGGQELVTETTVRCPLSLVAAIGDTVHLPEPFAGTWEITSIAANDGAGTPTPTHRKLSLTQQVVAPGGGGGIYG